MTHPLDITGKLVRLLQNCSFATVLQCTRYAVPPGRQCAFLMQWCDRVLSQARDIHCLWYVQIALIVQDRVLAARRRYWLKAHTPLVRCEAKHSFRHWYTRPPPPQQRLVINITLCRFRECSLLEIFEFYSKRTLFTLNFASYKRLL